jgi:hypothetical protein
VFLQILQTSLKEKDQSIHDQAMLITRLTSKIEANEEALDRLKEKLHKTQHELQTETDRFHMKLSETQKYFEEMLADVDAKNKRLKTMILDKEGQITQREDDLRQIIQRHEQVGLFLSLCLKYLWCIIIGVWVPRQSRNPVRGKCLRLWTSLFLYFIIVYFFAPS